MADQLLKGPSSKFLFIQLYEKEKTTSVVCPLLKFTRYIRTYEIRGNETDVYARFYNVGWGNFCQVRGAVVVIRFFYGLHMVLFCSIDV